MLLPEQQEPNKEQKNPFFGSDRSLMLNRISGSVDLLWSIRQSCSRTLSSSGSALQKILQSFPSEVRGQTKGSLRAAASG